MELSDFPEVIPGEIKQDKNLNQGLQIPNPALMKDSVGPDRKSPRPRTGDQRLNFTFAIGSWCNVKIPIFSRGYGDKNTKSLTLLENAVKIKVILRLVTGMFK